MIGQDKMNELFWAEVKRANSLKGHSTLYPLMKGIKNGKDSKSSLPGGRLQAAYPDTWEQLVWAKVHRTHCSVTDLIDHCYSECKRIFKVRAKMVT